MYRYTDTMCLFSDIHKGVGDGGILIMKIESTKKILQKDLIYLKISEKNISVYTCVYEYFSFIENKTIFLRLVKNL